MGSSRWHNWGVSIITGVSVHNWVTIRALLWAPCMTTGRQGLYTYSVGRVTGCASPALSKAAYATRHEYRLLWNLEWTLHWIKLNALESEIEIHETRCWEKAMMMKHASVRVGLTNNQSFGIEEHRVMLLRIDVRNSIQTDLHIANTLSLLAGLCKNLDLNALKGSSTHLSRQERILEKPYSSARAIVILIPCNAMEGFNDSCMDSRLHWRKKQQPEWWIGARWTIPNPQRSETQV